jgi:hypothetical protein
MRLPAPERYEDWVPEVHIQVYSPKILSEQDRNLLEMTI